MPLKRSIRKNQVIYVKGKRKKRVPIIFTKEVQKAIETLLRYREQMKVDEHNHFLFPRPTRGSPNAVRGWDIVHKVLLKTDLEKPELINSTKI